MSNMRESSGLRERWRRWGHLYGIVFVTVFVLLIVYDVWQAAYASVQESAHMILSNIGRTGEKATYITVFLMEVVAIMMGTGDAIARWARERSEKRQAQIREEAFKEGEARGEARGRAEGEARGEARGRAEGVARARAYYERMMAAKERGEPFNEPPPSEQNTTT